MNSSNLSLYEFKEKEAFFYKNVLKKRKSLPSQEIEEIKVFLKNIEKLSKAENLPSEDYRWLSDVAVKWHSVFSTIFEEPIRITLSDPNSLVSTPSAIVSEESIENKIRKYAYNIAFNRRMRELVDEYEIKKRELEKEKNIITNDDTNKGEVYFVSDVFDGCPNLRFISPASYQHLEHVWSRDLKVHRAYFVWLTNKQNGIEKNNNDENYYEACANIREMLGFSEIKLSSSYFMNAKNYIQENYLDEKNKLKRDGNDYVYKVKHDLIEKKSYRISDITGCIDSFKNWVNAETYTKMFYEDIIPAVLEKDKEKTLRILKAFQYSKMQNFLIINCFELALAVYFLDANIVQELWNESELKRKDKEIHELPKSAMESVVFIESWPSDFKEKIAESDHCKTRFWSVGDRIGFEGVMLDVEKNALLKALKKTSESKELKSIHAKAIEELYEQSRIIFKETTI